MDKGSRFERIVKNWRHPVHLPHNLPFFSFLEVPLVKPKDLRDFFSQELGKALIPDRFIDIFQGKSPRNVLAKHYTPQGIRLLREICEKANLRILPLEKKEDGFGF